MIITKYSLPTTDFATRYSTRYSDFLVQPYSNPTRSQKSLLVGACWCDSGMWGNWWSCWPWWPWQPWVGIHPSRTSWFPSAVDFASLEKSGDVFPNTIPSGDQNDTNEYSYWKWYEYIQISVTLWWWHTCGTVVVENETVSVAVARPKKAVILETSLKWNLIYL